MKRKQTVVFTHDKHGRKIAYRVGGDWRLFRMSLAEAQVMLSTGDAVDESEGWRDYFKRLHNDRAAQEGRKPSKRCDSCGDFCYKVGGVHGC